jgi:hypothetical protein
LQIPPLDRIIGAMASMLIVGAGLAVLGGTLVAAIKRRREPRRAARVIVAGFAICILLVSVGLATASLN